MLNKLIIDTEFRLLVQPISPEALLSLQEDILLNGKKLPVLVWEGNIIDGYEIYELCQKHNIPVTVSSKKFSVRSQAISWICRRQLTRQDLIVETRRYLLGKYFESEKKLFLQSSATNPDKEHPSSQYEIASRIGNEFNMSTSSIYKYGIYARAVDDIISKEPAVAEKILSAKIKISQDNIVELSRLPKENVRNLNKNLAELGISRVSYSDMRHELQWKNLPTPPKPGKPEKKVDFPIKQTPKYDPDAEISSLSLTVPSWISSINRVRDSPSMAFTTASARKDLKLKLSDLKASIVNLVKLMEEY